MRRPWLVTLSKMGYTAAHWTWPILGVSAVVLWIVWRFDPRAIRLSVE